MSGIPARSNSLARLFLTLNHLTLFAPVQTQPFNTTGCNAMCLNVIFKWFKFTLKPPYSGASERSLYAIWDTSHWNFLVKFGLRTA